MLLCNTNIYEICKLRKAISSAFYNISQNALFSCADIFLLLLSSKVISNRNCTFGMLFLSFRDGFEISRNRHYLADTFYCFYNDRICFS